MQELIQLDQALSASFSQFVSQNSYISFLFVVVGVGFVYIVPFILLFTWFVISRKTGLRAALAGILAWEGLSKVIAHTVDRARPSMSQIGAKELIFHRPDTSFPSDHSAFLAAVALSFYLSGQKKLAILVGLLAVAIGITRVGIGVHFPADILAGWAVGCLVAWLIHLIDEPLDKYLLTPLINFARKLKL